MREPEFSGFEVTFSPDGRELLVGPGRIASEGFIVDDDHERSVGVEHPFHDAGVLTPERLEGQSHLLYLDVWRRYLAPLEDCATGEVALGGPETGGRIAIGWDLRVLVDDRTEPAAPFDATDVSCADPIDLWDRLTADSGGMSARAKSGREARKGRITGAPAGYHGIENRYYRVEIRDSGPVGEATFTWSRENSTHVQQSTPTSSEFVEIDEGVEVTFEDCSYRAGDYWIVRTANRAHASTREVEVLARGVDHRFARLALIRWGKAIEDCRRDCEEAD